MGVLKVKEDDGSWTELGLGATNAYIGAKSYEHYKGSYQVTPLVTTQVLTTKEKLMDDNVTVYMIPTQEIQNDAGGVTFIVG